MVLVDSSVWIDFFKNKKTKEVKLLEQAIQNHETICTCGIILTEVLQGIKVDKEFKFVKEKLKLTTTIPMFNDSFIQAAEIYRGLRKKGITIRKANDCIIAAVALLADISLLHNDKDFSPIEEHFGLKAY